MRLCLLLVVLLFSLTASAMSNQESLPDSLTQAPTDSNRTRPRPAITWAFNLDFRNSFIMRHPVNVWGVNSGITFGRKRHHLTLGYYWLTYANQLRLINWRRDAVQRVNLGYYTRTDVWFMSLLYWPNLIHNKRWILSTPVEVGAGKALALPTTLGTDQEAPRTQSGFFVPVQVGLYSQWKATRWVGLSTQVGYRYAFHSAQSVPFNGAYYSFGATVFPAFWTDLWRAIRHKERISPFRDPISRRGKLHD
ncbi:hypothetical protein [Rudanella lutea]|uniref:hypothetical protein n=1 Tax=Rudanella lutea TaxID=451374 RepID=UPI00035DF4C7|nr:hypothetical protein [Rudanella lutea]